MSILNAWAERETALVAVDSEALGPNGERMAAEKLFALPLSRAVFSGRGDAGFLTMVALALATGGHKSRSLDYLAGLLPALLPVLARSYPQVAAAQGMPLDRLPPQTVVLVGWSDTAQRMRLCEFEIEGDAVAHATPAHHVAPWDASIDHLTKARTVPDIIDLAEAQVRLMRERAPDAAAGGTLTVAHITRHSITVGPVHQLAGRREIA
jgi:hypothetical protein